MKDGLKKLITIFVIFTIVVTSIFIVVTQYELKSVIESDKLEKSIPLFAKILCDQPSGAAPHEVDFEALVVNNVGDVKYLWNFGDGETSEEVKPTHTYKEIGSYACTLTVADVNGKELIEQVNITVLQNNPPLVKIVVDKVTGNRPTKINFDASCFDVDGEIVSYEWEITEPPIFANQKVTKYNEKNFSKVFIRPGFYEVKLTVTDDAKNSVTDYMKLQILKSKPELLLNSITSLISMGLYYYGIVNSLKDIINKIINNPPNMPSDPSPPDNVTNVDSNADLSWNCSDPNGQKLTYDIYFGTTSPPPLVISGYSSTNFDLGPLLDGNTYYWKIVAKDSLGATTTGPIWSFITQ